MLLVGRPREKQMFTVWGDLQQLLELFCLLFPQIASLHKALKPKWAAKKHTNKADESIIPSFLGDMFQSVCSVFLQEMFNIYRWRNSGLLVFLDSFLTCSLFSPHLLPSFVAFRCKWPQQTPVQDPGGILHRQPRENVGDRCGNALITHSQHPALPAAGGKSSLC